jgi:nucleotide-binding universal stress UspA family protein
MMTISKILVPIDFSETSLKALDQAMELAATVGAMVIVMHAYEIPTMGLGLVPEATFVASASDAGRIASIAQSALRGVVDAHADRGVIIESVLREGPAWREIDAVAEEMGADLIVIGTHGRRGIVRALLGSVADKVVRLAHRPVLTIHAPGG